MSVTSFFEKFIGLQQQRAQEKVATYRELVAGIATGDEPNPAEVERLLADAGKSLDDLRRDVEQYQHRMALRATVAEMPGLEAERRSIDEQIAAADQILEAAEQQHDQTTEPLYARRREITQALAEGSTALGELVRTCGDPDVIREMNDHDAEARQLSERLRDLFSRAANMEQSARNERERADQEASFSEAEGRREVADRYKKDAEATRREMKQVEKAIADLAKRREQIEQRMRQA